MEIEERNESQTPAFSNYLPSVAIVGAIFSVISFVLGIFFGYQQINADPSGAIFSPLMMSGVIVCLITCVGGAVSVWHYTKEVSPVLTLGQGSLIGFLTGVVIVLATVVFNEIWTLIDPDYTEKLIEATIANVEAMDLPQGAKDDMVDSMVEGVRSSQSVTQQIFWGIPVTGLLNLITGMIGTKIFAKKEENF
jgi:hypothetical protein